MYADVRIDSVLGVGLIVPDSAILGTGERDIVFVDRGGGVFEPRQVTVGLRLPDDVEVRGGLVEGERVLTSGNFFIDSESNLKAALAAAGPSRPAAPADANAPGRAH